MKLARTSAIRTLILCLGIHSVAVSAETLRATDSSSSDDQKNIRRRLDTIEGQYVVLFKDQQAVGTDATLDPVLGTIKAQVESSVADLGGTVLHSYAYAVNGFAGILTAEALDALNQNPNVASIQQDTVGYLTATQTPVLNWGLDRIDQRSGRDGVYTYSATGAGVHVYVVDTGIRSTHEEFTGRLGVGHNVLTIPAGSPQAWDDCNGHGTHVASTVGGTKYGVAKSVTLHAVRVFACTGTNSNSETIAGLDWVMGQHTANKGQKSVVNMSLGSNLDATLNQAVKNLVAAGIVVVVSAGDGNVDACNISPASADNVITVGATDTSDSRSIYLQGQASNWGPCVEIFAPGSEIYGAGISSNTATVILGGTSMASPHVAGVAALYMEKIAATPKQIASMMLAYSVSGIVSDAKSASNKFLQSSLPSNCRTPNKACRKLFCKWTKSCCCLGLECKGGACR